MIDAESRYFESSRLRMHYTVWGDESLPPLVMVHGMRDHGRNWDFVAERLLDRFFVYSLDLRGHGDSEWASGGDYALVDFIGDLDKMIQVIDRGPVWIVAHSLGGRIVVDYAAARPENVRKIVAIEGFARWPNEAPAIDRFRAYLHDLRELEVRHPRPYPSLEEAYERMREANRRLSPEMVRHLTEHGSRRQEDGTYVWKYDNNLRLRPPAEWTVEEMKAIFSEVKAPTLHIGGSDSWGRSPEERQVIARAVPDSRLIMMDNAGHWVHHDRLDAVVDAIRDFLVE